MRTSKTSSGDRTSDPYKYLHGIPEQQRVRLNGQIIRNGTLKGGSHREVILIVDNKIIHHKIQ